MKPQTITSVHAVLHEELALKRIKELTWTEAPPPERKFRWRDLWIAPTRACFWLFEPLELVREVAPGKPPLRREEWERKESYPLF